MKPNKKFRFSIIVFLPITILIFIIVVGYYFNEQKRLILHTKGETIESTSKLKQKMISDWINDEVIDIKALTKSEITKDLISAYLKYKNKNAIETLTKYLDEKRREHNIEDFYIVNKQDIVFSTQRKAKFSPILRNMIDKCDDSINPIVSEVIKDTLTNTLNIYFASAFDEEINETIYYIIIRKDFRKAIYPILSINPFTSETLESFLVTTSNDSILYLSELKFYPNAPLNLKISLKNKNLPAAKALTGSKGLFEGINYRGKEVISYAIPIPETGWILITNIDKDEFLKEFYLLNTFFYLFLFISFLGVLTSSFLILKSREQMIFKELYEAEKNLKHSIERFKITIDSLSEGVITTDIDGKIDYMNRLAEELTGWNFREAKGRKLEEVYQIKSEFTGEWELNPAQKVLKLGIVKGLANHTILVSKLGKEVPVADTGAPIRDVNGNIVGVAIVFQDETERRTYEKLLIQSEQKFRDTLDNLNEGCQIISYDWRYIYLNKEALRQLRKTKKEMIGQQIFDCYPGIEKTPFFAKLLYCMNDRATETFESEFQYPDGQKGYFLVTVQPVEEGILVLTKDITALKIVEKELAKSEQKYRELAENISEFLFQIEPVTFKITFANKACDDIFKIEFQDALNSEKPFYELISFENPEKFYEEFVSGINSNENFLIISKIFNKKNKPIYCKFRFTLSKSNDFTIDRIICIAYDFTNEFELQKQLIEREKFISTIFDTVDETIAILSYPERIIIDINKAVERYLGYTREELIGKSVEFLHINKDKYEEIAEIYKKMINGVNNIEFEWPVKRKDGSIFWGEVNISFIKDDETIKYILVTLRDISERKKMIEELIKAKEEAEEANRIKDGFISAMSHEIRTPLNVIMGFTDLLKDSMSKETDQDKILFLEGILKGAKRLLRTGTIILDGSRLDAKDIKIELKEVPLNYLVEAIAEQKRPLAIEKNLNYKVQLSPEKIIVIGDEYAINSILDNIIDNAIKFSNKGTIEIKTEIFENKGRVIVKDEGVGISEKFLNYIYDKFSQEEVGTRRPFEGLGLGLYLTKKFVKLCGAELKIESKKDIGTTVIVDFQLKS